MRGLSSSIVRSWKTAENAIMSHARSCEKPKLIFDIFDLMICDGILN